MGVMPGLGELSSGHGPGQNVVKSGYTVRQSLAHDTHGNILEMLSISLEPPSSSEDFFFPFFSLVIPRHNIAQSVPACNSRLQLFSN